jgi:hypothetical protein
VSVFQAYFEAVSYFVVFLVLAISVAGQVRGDRQPRDTTRD